MMVSIVLLAWLGGFGYFFRDIYMPDNSPSVMSRTERQQLDHEKLVKRQELTKRLKAAMLRQSEVHAGVAAAADTKAVAPAKDKTTAEVDGHKRGEIAGGWVSIVDPWGGQAARFRSAVSAGGWLALPDRACLAGWKWLFYRDYGNVQTIENGLWPNADDSGHRNGDMVGLWRLDQKTEKSGVMSLKAWDAGQPVDWLSLESVNRQNSIQLRAGESQGDFSICLLPDNLAEIGIFVQNAHLVGWTFGQWLNRAYMWSGGNGNELQVNRTVRDFYGQTFAGGREEAFARGLGMAGKHPNQEELAVLVAAYKLPARLAPADTPAYLLPDEVIKQIRILVETEVRAGNGRLVVKTLDADALLAIGDIDLLMDMVPVVTAARGFAAATSLIEKTGRAIVQADGHDVPELNDLHAKLYQDWLQSLVTVQAVDEAMPIWQTASDYYPDDAYIKLLGVELFLQDNNWQEAERLLYSRDYPSSLRDRFEVLAGRISEMKGEEGKIVIHFSPGANRIPVQATLNSGLNLDFMVDTGASMVTIPSYVADQLGLEIIEGYHGSSQIVSTAGGAVSATQVMIDSLEIDGWVEKNVRALVIDIPDQPGVGLLGLNYLQRFKMDLNSNAGTLLLSPK